MNESSIGPSGCISKKLVVMVRGRVVSGPKRRDKKYTAMSRDGTPPNSVIFLHLQRSGRVPPALSALAETRRCRGRDRVVVIGRSSTQTRDPSSPEHANFSTTFVTALYRPRAALALNTTSEPPDHPPPSGTDLTARTRFNRYRRWVGGGVSKPTMVPIFYPIPAVYAPLPRRIA